MNNYLDLKNIKAFSEYSKLEEAGQVIRNGGLVLFPTETVYGLGANGLNSEAVKNIYVAKGRSSDNPLILHISDIEMLGKIAKDISDVEFKLMNAFWPGPFTIILNKTDAVPSVVAGGLDTVGIRMPSNEIAKNLIKYADVPIAAPSANISGRPSGTNVEDIDQELKDGIPHILRPGKITAEEIKEIAGSVIIDKHILGKLDVNEKVMSPGMKYKHYAPNTKCVLVYNENTEILRANICKIVGDCYTSNKVPLVMCLDENAEFLKNMYQNLQIFNLGSSLDEMSKNIFTDLRKADKTNADLIIIQGVSTDGLGLAIMNRLLRACNFNIIR